MRRGRTIGVVIIFCLLFSVLMAGQGPSLKGAVTNITDTSWVVDIVDTGDIVWFGTKGGLVKYDEAWGDAVKYYTTAEGLIDNRITCLEPCTEGLLIGTQEGVSYFEPEKENWLTFPSPRVIDIEFLSGQNIAWIYHYKGVMKVDIGTKEAEGFSFAQQLNKSIARVFRDGNTFWCTVKNGLIYLNPETKEKKVFKLKLPVIPDIRNDVKRVYFTPRSVWLTYECPHFPIGYPDLPGAGLSRFDKMTKQWKSYGEKDGLASPYIRDAAFYDGKFWVACQGYYDKSEKKFVHGGLSCFDPEKEAWLTFHNISDKNYDNPTAIELINGELWVATQHYKKIIEVRNPFGMIYRIIHTPDVIGLTLNKYNKEKEKWVSYFIPYGVDLDWITSFFKFGADIGLCLNCAPGDFEGREQKIVHSLWVSGLAIYNLETKEWNFTGLHRLLGEGPKTIKGDLWTMSAKSMSFPYYLNQMYISKWDKEQRRWKKLEPPTRSPCPQIICLPSHPPYYEVNPNFYAGGNTGRVLKINVDKATTELMATIRLKAMRNWEWKTIISHIFYGLRRPGIIIGCTGEKHLEERGERTHGWEVESGLIMLHNGDRFFYEVGDVPWSSKTKYLKQSLNSKEEEQEAPPVDIEKAITLGMPIRPSTSILPEEGISCGFCGQKNLWVGTWHWGIFHGELLSTEMEQTKWHSIGPESKVGVNWDKHFDYREVYNKQDTSLIDNAVLAIVEDKDQLWALFGDGLWGYDTESKEWKHYGGPKTQLPRREQWLPRYHALFRSDLVLGKDGLWVTSPEGTFFFQPDKEQWEELEPELPGRCLFWHNDLLWIGTDEGLVCCNPESRKLVRYRERDGLADDVVNDIGHWHDQLMVGTNNGLSLINLKEFK